MGKTDLKVYQGETLSALLKYMITTLILVIAGTVLLSFSGIIGEILLIAAISAPIALAGKLLTDRNRTYSGVITKRFLAWMPLEFVLSLAIYSILYAPLGGFSAEGVFLAFLFLLIFVSLRFTASALIKNGPRAQVGGWLYRLAWSPLLISAYFASFILGGYYYVGYPFLFAGIGNIPFSLHPLLELSRNRQIKELSTYIRDSSSSYLTGFFLLGLAFSVLQIPKPYVANEFILFFLLLGTIVMILFAFWRWYSIGTGRIESLYNTMYLAHRHTPKIVSDDQSDLFANSVKEFVVRGKKGELLVTLSHLLGSNDVDLEDSLAILERLRIYGGEQTELNNPAFSARTISKEIEKRVDTVNSIAIVMRKRLEEKI